MQTGLRTPHNRPQPLGFAAEAIVKRAEQHARDSQHAQAAADYQILADLDPDNERFGLKLAHHLVAIGRYQRAADVYFRVAAVLAKQGALKRSGIAAARAVRLDASRATRRRLEPWVALVGRAAEALCEEASRLHLLAERRADARDLLRLMLEHDPSSLGKRLRLAEVSLAQGVIDEGLRQLRLVAEGLAQHGRTGEFVRVSEMYIAHGGQDPWALRSLANHYLRGGDIPRALAKFSALVRSAPDDLAALERLASINAMRGAPGPATAQLSRLVQRMAESNDRSELRALFVRAEAWSTDDAFLRELEMLRVSTLCEGKVPRRPRRAGSTPPPPPPSRRPYGVLTTAGVPSTASPLVSQGQI